MVSLGVVRPLNSPWASPLHMETMWGLPCTPRELSLSTHSRFFAATKWQKTLFQVGSRPSVRSDANGSWRHCEDSCYHALRSLRVPKDAHWSWHAAQSIHRFIDQIFRGLEFDHAYIDDVLIASSNPEVHNLRLLQVFQRLDQYGIAANPEKCNFGHTEIIFLDHRIDDHGISPLPEKTQSIVEYLVPQSVKTLCRFLGMVNYYRRIILNYAQILHSLTDLLKCNAKHFTMTPEAEAAFATRKQHLYNATKLSYLSTSTLAKIVLKRMSHK